MSELAKLLPDGNLKIPEEFKEKLGLKAGDLLKVIANWGHFVDVVDEWHPNVHPNVRSIQNRVRL